MKMSRQICFEQNAVDVIIQIIQRILTL